MTDALSRAEQAWLEHRRTDDKPSRSLRSRIQKATDRWSVEAGWVAVGLTSATATLPPTARGDKLRRSNAPSDPTGAALVATLDTVAREAEAFAHLTGSCARDGERDERGQLHMCPDGSAVDVADVAGLHLDPEEIVDGLLGTPPSSTKAFAAVVSAASSWHTQTAATLLDCWIDGWREGTEPSLLDAWASESEALARRMASLAGRLAAWSGRSEATCACGCGRPRPAAGQGATRSGCRSRMQRERDGGAA